LIQKNNIMNPESYPFLKEPTEITKQNWSDDVPPLLSIVNNTYNHENFISEAIEGFLMQKTTFKVEILVHDDASTDKTAAIIREYEKKYPKLILPIYQTTNQYSQGISPNLEYQLPRVRGKYIALCEGDDYWTDPLKLQKQVDFLERNQDYSMCAGRVKYFHQELHEMKDDYNVRQFDSETEGLEVNLENLFNPYIIRTCTLLYRTEYMNVEEIIKYKYFKDIFLFSILLSKGKGFVFNDLHGVYRKHLGGVWTNATKLNQLQADVNTLTEMDEYFSHNVKSIIEFRRARIEQLQIEKKKINKNTSLKIVLKRFLIKLKIGK